MGRGHAALDPRLGPVAQLPSARHPALHGRHPDQHRRRLRRLPGDRSDRLPLRRGLQGRERAALRRQFARRRDQFRDADRPRRAARSTARVDVGSFGYLRGAGQLRRRARAVRLFRHRHRRSARTASATTATAMPSAAAPISATRSRRMSRRASTSTPTRCASAFRATVTKDVGAELAARRRRPTTSLQRLAAQHRHACASPTRRRCGFGRHDASSSACSASTAT